VLPDFPITIDYFKE